MRAYSLELTLSQGSGGEKMNYSIGDFARLTGLTAHTLRYYEKEGLLEPERKSNGQRFHSVRDLEWVTFIKRLKETYMPLKEIKQYATLRALGDPTLKERQELLTTHRENLIQEITLLQDHLNKLDLKIDYYDSKLMSKEKENDRTKIVI